jgi:hypothetical protein
MLDPRVCEVISVWNAAGRPQEFLSVAIGEFVSRDEVDCLGIPRYGVEDERHPDGWVYFSDLVEALSRPVRPVKMSIHNGILLDVAQVQPGFEVVCVDSTVNGTYHSGCNLLQDLLYEVKE